MKIEKYIALLAFALSTSIVCSNEDYITKDEKENLERSIEEKNPENNSNSSLTGKFFKKALDPTLKVLGNMTQYAVKQKSEEFINKDIKNFSRQANDLLTDATMKTIGAGFVTNAGVAKLKGHHPIVNIGNIALASTVPIAAQHLNRLNKEGQSKFEKTSNALAKQIADAEKLIIQLNINFALDTLSQEKTINNIIDYINAKGIKSHNALLNAYINYHSTGVIPQESDINEAKEKLKTNFINEVNKREAALLNATPEQQELLAKQIFYEEKKSQIINAEIKNILNVRTQDFNVFKKKFEAIASSVLPKEEIAGIIDDLKEENKVIIGNIELKNFPGKIKRIDMMLQKLKECIDEDPRLSQAFYNKGLEKVELTNIQKNALSTALTALDENRKLTDNLKNNIVEKITSTESIQKFNELTKNEHISNLTALGIGFDIYNKKQLKLPKDFQNNIIQVAAGEAIQGAEEYWKKEPQKIREINNLAEIVFKKSQLFTPNDRPKELPEF